MSENNNPNEIFINDLCKKVTIIENIFKKGEIEKTLIDFEKEILLKKEDNTYNNIDNDLDKIIENWRKEFKENLKINEIIKSLLEENYKNDLNIQIEIKRNLKSIIEFLIKKTDQSIINFLIPQFIKSILLYIGFIRIVLFSNITMTDAIKEIEIKDLHETIKLVINFISNNIKSLKSLPKEQYNGIDLILKSDISIYPIDYQLIIEKPYQSRSQCDGCIQDLETEYYPEVLVPITENPIIFRVDAQCIRQSPISEHALGRIYTFKIEPITNCVGQFLSDQLSLKVKLANASTSFKNKSISIRVFSILHYDDTNNDENCFNYQIQLGNNQDTVKMISDIDHEFSIINDNSYNLIKSLNIKPPFKCGYSGTTIEFSKDLGTDPILNIRHKLQKPTSTLITDISGRVLFIEIIVKKQN
ncbi:hypothetical protein RB653_003150 [Dictyostelium firmibasis]|uniref:Uncharacterized protein n=1 Tax=Dictyostelium firmibasis TaxID=79012 RepID=A0AAN7YW71_9MYCE